MRCRYCTSPARFSVDRVEEEHHRHILDSIDACGKHLSVAVGRATVNGCIAVVRMRR